MSERQERRPTPLYRAKCRDPKCKHEWTSRAGMGVPDFCPKCRGKNIEVKPIGPYA